MIPKGIPILVLSKLPPEFRFLLPTIAISVSKTPITMITIFVDSLLFF